MYVPTKLCHPVQLHIPMQMGRNESAYTFS